MSPHNNGAHNGDTQKLNETMGRFVSGASGATCAPRPAATSARAIDIWRARAPILNGARRQARISATWRAPDVVGSLATLVGAR